MRTIKFRGKSLDNNCWVYGYYYLTKASSNLYFYIREFGENGGKRIRPETLCENTGWTLFHTKLQTNESLYENDVLRDSDGSHYIVKHRAGGFAVFDHDGKPPKGVGGLYNLNGLFNPWPVIIGNIFDSVDLRKEFENVR